MPLRNFIQWIPQLISHFHFHEPHLLDKLLIRLAETHPQAIFYAFKSSYNHFHKKSTIPNRPAVQQILDAIANPSLELLVSNVNCMVLPEKIVEQTFLKLRNELFDEYGQDEYVAQLQTCYDEVFQNAQRSEIPKQYDHIKAVIGELMKLNGKYTVSISLNTYNRTRYKMFLSISFLCSIVRTALDRISRTLSETIEHIRGQLNVSFTTTDGLCPWFHQYHWYGGNECIELPGQYDANYRPIDKHLKIVKFERKIRVFKSLRKPIQLTVLATDGKLHSYLIKYGEDLRQDERIQQMQTIMSDHLSNDKYCSRHRLRLRTYSVTPLNAVCGMISWVNNTQPLDEFVARSMPNFHQRNRDAAVKYLNLRPAGSSNQRRPPLTAFLRLSRAQVNDLCHFKSVIFFL